MTLRKGFIVVVLALSLIAVMFTGCDAGMTKEERLEAFKEDALAGRNLRSHFSGSNAGEVNSNTFTDIFDTTDNLSINSSSSISGTSFSFDWSTDTAGSCTANGTFVSENSGLGEDWYIYQIDPDNGSGNIPTY